jgi:hypothetical protein
MSVELPLQYKDGVTISDLSSQPKYGREFSHVSSQMANRGLIRPVANDKGKLGFIPSMKRMNLSGIDMMPVAYDGLIQGEDYMTFTDLQAYNELENAVQRASRRGYTNDLVMDADGYTLGSENTDPRLLPELHRGSILADDNVYHRFTQNYIREMQQGNEQLYEESNLYYLPPATAQGQITSADVQTLAPGIIAQGQAVESARKESEIKQQGEKKIKTEESLDLKAFEGSPDKKTFIENIKDTKKFAKSLVRSQRALNMFATAAEASGAPQELVSAIRSYSQASGDIGVAIGTIQQIIDTIQRTTEVAAAPYEYLPNLRQVATGIFG